MLYTRQRSKRDACSGAAQKFLCHAHRAFLLCKRDRHWELLHGAGAKLHASGWGALSRVPALSQQHSVDIGLFPLEAIERGVRFLERGLLN
jgi:hypothetical protein